MSPWNTLISCIQRGAKRKAQPQRRMPTGATLSRRRRGTLLALPRLPWMNHAASHLLLCVRVQGIEARAGRAGRRAENSNALGVCDSASLYALWTHLAGEADDRRNIAHAQPTRRPVLLTQRRDDQRRTHALRAVSAHEAHGSAATLCRSGQECFDLVGVDAAESNDGAQLGRGLLPRRRHVDAWLRPVRVDLCARSLPREINRKWPGPHHPRA